MTYRKYYVSNYVHIYRFHLMPICPAARICLYLAYAPLIEVGHFEKQFNSVYFDLNTAQQGFYIERLLITLINLGMLDQVEINTISANGNKEMSQKTILVLKNYTVINFGGYFAPPQQEIDKKEAKYLFVPTAYNYPGFDFFTYTENYKTALFFQVTIMKNCQNHVSSNDEKANSKSTKAGTLPAAMKVISIDFSVSCTIIV